MADLIKCVALVAFTRFVSGYGQVHGDPDSSDDAAVNPMVPAEVIERFAAEELIAAPTGDAPAKAAPAKAPAAKAPAAKAKSKSGATPETIAARERFEQVFGKKPFLGWDAAELTKRIDAELAKQAGAGADGTGQSEGAGADDDLPPV